MPSYWETFKGVLPYHILANPVFYLPYFWNDEKSLVLSIGYLKIYLKYGIFRFYVDSANADKP